MPHFRAANLAHHIENTTVIATGGKRRRISHPAFSKGRILPDHDYIGVCHEMMSAGQLPFGEFSV
jgi:hypothetical protein